MRACFDDCVLDTGRRQLTRAGAVVPLPPKALRLLEVLIEARPRALSHHELHEALWPDTFVARTNLPSLVAELRQAIGDGVRQSRFIRTVHGFGYAFEGEVVDRPALSTGRQRPERSHFDWCSRVAKSHCERERTFSGGPPTQSSGSTIRTSPVVTHAL